MANNPVATMTARVQIDKQSVMDDFLKDIKDVQKVADGNAIVYKLKANKDSLKDVLKQIQDSDLQMGVDVVIKAKSKDIKAQIDKLFGDIPSIEVDTNLTKNVKDLDEEIKRITKDLTGAQKVLGQMGNSLNADELKKQLRALNDELNNSGDMSDRVYDKKAKQFLDIAYALKEVGCVLSSKEGDQDLIDNFKNFTDYYKNYKPKSLLGNPEEIQKQKDLVESLTNQLAELTAQKEKMAQADMSASSGEGLADSLNKESAEIKDAARNFEKATGELEQASNKYDDILNKSYVTSGKREATSQLKSAYEEYMKFFNADNGLEKDAIIRNMSDAGREAAYSYYKALEEALKQGISQNSLEKYFAPDIDDRVISKNLTDESRLEELKYSFSEFTTFIQEQARIAREVQFVDTEQAREALSIYMDAWDLWRARSDNFTDLESTKDEQEWTESAKKNLIEVVALEKELIAQGKQSVPFNEEFTVSTEKAKETAEETTDKVEKETEAFKEVGAAAEKATKEKEKFAEANIAVAQSGEKTEQQADETTSSIEKKNEALKENIDLMKILNDLQGKGTVFNLGSAFNQGLSKEMALAQIDNMAPAIATAYNEKFGVEFTSKQIANALKAQMKAEEAELQKALSELENKRIEVYKDVDESVFIDQIQQQKKMLAETEEIRAYNESLRADKAMQDAMNLANVNAEEEIAREKELARIEKEKIKLSNDWTEALKENARVDKERAKEVAERAKLPLDVQKELTNLDKIIAKYEQYATVSKEAADAVKKLKDARTSLKIRNTKDEIIGAKNTRELNSNTLESLVINKDLVKSSSLDAAQRKITQLGDSILNDTRLFNKFDSEVIQLEADLQKVGTNAGLEQIDSRIKKITDSINEETKALKKVDAEQEKIKKQTETASSKSKADLNKTAKESYNELTRKAQDYYDLLKKEAADSLTGSEKKVLEELKQEWDNATKAVGKYKTATGASADSIKNVSKARAKFNQSDVQVALGYSQELSQTETKLRDLAKSDKYTSKLRTELEALANRIATINKTPIDLKADGTIEELSKIDTSIDEAFKKTKVEEFRKASELSIAKLNLKIEKFMQENTAMGRGFREQFENLKLDWDSEYSYEKLQELSRAFIKLEADVEKARLTGKSFFDTLKDRMDGLNAQFLARYFSWEDWLRYARELAQNIVNIDTALTELRKVSDATSERLQQSFEKSAQSAQELGSTITDVINITSDWARLGYDVDQAEELARVTTLFKTVGDNMSAEDASSYLVSTMQGFQLAADQAESIVDKYNEVANNFAIDTAGIGEALKRSAASFNSANTDLSKAIALITATNEVVQNPESVGTLWKTMSARIRGAKTELEELGEEEDDFTNTTSKLRDLVQQLTDFDIMKNETEFKDIYEIILGIGQKWDELTDIERASLGEALAGKRNANALYAVLGNLDTLQEAYKTAEKSANSASIEQENYAQSLQYSIDRVRASVEELSYDFTNTDFLKNLIELGNSAIQIIDKIVEHTNGLLDLLAILSTYLGIKFKKEIASLAKDIISYFKTFGLMFQQAGVASAGMSAGMAGFTTIASSLGPIALAIAAVTAALVIGAKAWDNYQTSVKEWQDKISETEKTLSSLKREIEELNAIDFKTQDEQKRLNVLKKEYDYQKQLLEVEKERANIQKYGTNSPAQLYDKDNAINVYENYLTKRIESWGTFGNLEYSLNNGQTYELSNIKKATEELSKYNEQIEKAKFDTDEYAEASERKKQVEEEALNSYHELIIQTSEYRQELQTAEEALKGFDEGSNAYESTAMLIAEYTQWIKENEETIEAFEKQTGRFDYSSIIESMLSKVEFDGIETQLVELAKAGNLTVDSLKDMDNVKIVNLLSQLDDAGVEAEVLYSWILRIAGLVDKRSLSGSIVNEMGGHKKGWQYDRAKLDAYFDSLPEEDARIAEGLEIELSAYMDADEVIDKYQREIDNAKGNPLTVEVRSTITDSVENINQRLKPQFDELSSLYQSIFYGKNGTFSLEKVTNDQLESIKKAFLDAEDERGNKIGVQYKGAAEAVNEFIDTLTSAETKSKSLKEQQEIVQQAVNKLATKYFYAADGLKTLNKETADTIKQSLKQMGVANADDIVNSYLDLAEAYQTASENGLALATSSKEAIDALVKEKDIAAATAEQMYLYAYQKQVANTDNLTTTASVQALLNLANAANITGPALDALIQLLNQFGIADNWAAKGMDATANYVRQHALEQYKAAMSNITQEPLEIKFPNTETASGAGKDAANAYIESFEKELKALEVQRDSGVLGEAEFLDKYRELIEKYFKDVDGYGDEYSKRMADYWDRTISHMENVVSAIGKLLDKKISAAEEGKEAAISALEEEKEAAHEAYQTQIDDIQAQIDAIDEQIDAYDKQIDKINEQIDIYQKQIDAINKANEAREHAMALQKAQYELERSLNQRTRLVYTGEVGQMRYERDESAVRSAQESVNDAEDQLAIDAIQKQIDLLNEEIELIEKQKDALKEQQEELKKQQEAIQKMMDESDKYYDKLIKQQEEYWDRLIKALEKQKSKWEELIEQKELAEAFALIKEQMERLGYTVDDVLNDTPGAFEAFKDAYLNALVESKNGNEDFIEGLTYATGQAKEKFGELASAAEGISDSTEPLAESAENVKKFGDAASTAAEGVGKLKDAVSGIADGACPAECIDKLNNANFDGLVTSVNTLKEKLEEISKLLVGEDGSIESALSTLNDPKVLEELGKAFDTVYESVNNVITALGLESGGKGDSESSGTDSGNTGNGEKGKGEGTGLVQAIEKVKESADTFIGMSADDTGENAIGRFNLLKEAVDGVSKIIGTADDEGGEGEDSSTLIGAINDLYVKTNEALYGGGEGGNGAINAFNELAEAIAACAAAASELLGAINSIGEIDFSAFSNLLEGGGGGTSFLPKMGVPTFTYTGTAKTGPANFDGDWGVKKNEKSLVGELGPELIVDSKNGKYRLVGEEGPEITQLHKGDIVYNHKQTEAILDKKNQVKTLADGSVLTPLSSSAMNIQGRISQGFRESFPDFGEFRRIIKEQTLDLSNVIQRNNTPNITITNPQFTVTGVNGEQVMRQIEGAFEGLMLNAYQKAMS